MRTQEILEPPPLPRSMCFVIHFAELSLRLYCFANEETLSLDLLEGLSINHMMYCCDNCTQLEVKQKTLIETDLTQVKRL